MKRFALRIDFNGKIIVSDFEEAVDTNIERAKNLCAHAASGELDFLSIRDKNQQHYFSKEILKQSLISIVYEI